MEKYGESGWGMRASGALGGVEGLDEDAFCWLHGMYSHLTPRFSQRSQRGEPPEHLTCRLRHSVHAMGVLLLRTTGARRFEPSTGEDLGEAPEVALAEPDPGGLGVARTGSLRRVGLIGTAGRRKRGQRRVMRKNGEAGGPAERGAFIVLGNLL